MKIKFLITGLVSLASVTAAFAQNKEVDNALEQYNKYEGIYRQKQFATMAKTNITDAKTSIDKAAANEKTSNLPRTFAVKGAIYAALALADTVTSTATPLFITADEALKKGKELDTKGENKKLIDEAYRNLAQYKYNKAYKYYNSGNYAGAYEAFDYYRTVLPDDTNAIYYTGLAAINAKKYDAAISNYQTLLTSKFSKKEMIYGDLVTVYLMNKDTTGAMKAVTEAVSKYPANASLTNREIQLYLQTGRIKEVSDKMDKAIANDPKNKGLYYYAGYIYLQQKLYDKALEKLKQALVIDPEYYEANFNIGLCYLNPGIDIFNKANTLPPKAPQSQYDAIMKQAAVKFDAAKPYLEKAVTIDPKSFDALDALKKVYLGKKDNVNANLTQKKIDALKK